MRELFSIFAVTAVMALGFFAAPAHAQEDNCPAGAPWMCDMMGWSDPNITGDMTGKISGPYTGELNDEYRRDLCFNSPGDCDVYVEDDGVTASQAADGDSCSGVGTIVTSSGSREVEGCGDMTAGDSDGKFQRYYVRETFGFNNYFEITRF